MTHRCQSWSLPFPSGPDFFDNPVSSTHKALHARMGIVVDIAVGRRPLHSQIPLHLLIFHYRGTHAILAQVKVCEPHHAPKLWCVNYNEQVNTNRFKFRIALCQEIFADSQKTCSSLRRRIVMASIHDGFKQSVMP